MIAGLREADYAYIKVNERVLTDSEHKINVKIQHIIKILLLYG